MSTTNLIDSTTGIRQRISPAQPKFRPFSGGANIHTLASLRANQGDGKPDSNIQRLSELTKKVDDATESLNRLIEARRLADGNQVELQTYLENTRKSNREYQIKIDELMEKSQITINQSRTAISEWKTYQNQLQQPSFLSIIFYPLIFIFSWLKMKAHEILSCLKMI